MKTKLLLRGKHKGIIITFDRDFKHIKSYYPLYKEHKVGVIFLKLSKDQSNYWGIVRLVINNWEDIKRKFVDHDKPFAYQVSKSGIQRFEF